VDAELKKILDLNDRRKWLEKQHLPKRMAEYYYLCEKVANEATYLLRKKDGR